MDQVAMRAEMNFKLDLGNMCFPHQGNLAMDTAAWQTHQCDREEQIWLHTESFTLKVYFKSFFYFNLCILFALLQVNQSLKGCSL